MHYSGRCGQCASAATIPILKSKCKELFVAKPSARQKSAPPTFIPLCTQVSCKQATCVFRSDTPMSRLCQFGTILAFCKNRFPDEGVGFSIITIWTHFRAIDRASQPTCTSSHLSQHIAKTPIHSWTCIGQSLSFELPPLRTNTICTVFPET